MPFKSLKQQKFMFSQKPKLAKKWAEKYGTIKKSSDPLRERVLKARAI